MKKLTNDELGTLVTREMKAMMMDESLTKEQRFDILSAVMFNTDVDMPILKSFANALKVGFERINTNRYNSVERHRTKNRAIMKAKYAAIDAMDAMDGTESTPKDIASIASITGQSKAMHSIAKHNNIPLNSPSGIAGEIDDASSDDSRRETEPPDSRPRRKYGRDDPECAAALALAEELADTEAFRHARSNRNGLVKAIRSAFRKKKAAGEDGFEAVAAAIRSGLERWTECWAADDWRYAPGSLSDWIYDEKYLSPPRKKAAVEVGAGCGECGAVIG